MKFFILSCLLAVALAKQAIKQHSSSSNEESANISQEKFKQRNVFFQTSQEPSSSSSSEESAEASSVKSVQTEEQKVSLKQLEKIKQLYQDFYIPQLCQAVHQQQQAAMNPWSQVKTSRNAPVLKKEEDSSEESTSISQEEILKKIVDMVKINQFRQLAFPQVIQPVHQQQLAVHPWNAYPFAPFVRNF